MSEEGVNMSMDASARLGREMQHSEAPPIQTLPPIDVIEQLVPLSEATGQPRRDTVMIIGISFLYAATVAAAAGYGKSWWDAIHVAGFAESSRLIEMTDPRPGSWQSVVWVVVLALIALAMTSSAAISAFNAWNGHRWSRVASLGATVLSALAYFVNEWAWVAVPLAVVGTIILWLPPVGRYFHHWALFRSGEPAEATEWEDVFYGRLPRYRDEDAS